MAGGKASPRQKMINMMYLVLTALLALNVSSDLLNSIKIIADSLRQSAHTLSKKNDDLNHAIKDAVKKEQEQGNNKNEYLIKLGDEIKKETDKYVAELEGHIQKMYSDEVAGKDPETGKLKKPDESEKNYRYFMIVGPDGKAGKDTDNKGRGAGRARIIREHMLDYVDWANQKYFELLEEEDKEKPGAKDHFKDFVLDPKDDPNVSDNSDLKNKTWEYYTFHRSPAIANVAILEKLKNDLYVIEAELLELAKSKLKDVTFKIEELVAIDAPKSRTIVAGMPFETKLYVTVTSSQETKLKFEGKGIKPSDDGSYATMRLMADASVVPEGKNEGKQKYRAKIIVPKATGGVEELVVEDHFTVVKPVIQIQSEAAIIMYKDCGNDLIIDCPALGTQYDPEFEATAAKVMQSKSNPKKVRVIPSGSKCRVTVFQKDEKKRFKIEHKDFRVITPPKPTLQLRVGNSIYDGRKPIRASEKIYVEVVGDKEFAKTLPDDARYRITGVKILKKAGLGTAEEVGKIGASEPSPKTRKRVDLIALGLGDARRGTQLAFEVLGIERINFLRQSVPQDFSKADLYINAELE